MWDVGAGRAGGMIPVPPDLDLQRTLDNDGARETLYAKGGPFVELLARLGAFAHHPAEQTARSLALLGRVGALDYRYLAIDGQANYYNYEGGLADNFVTREGIGLDGWSPIIRRPPPTSCARLRATTRAGFALPSPPIPGRRSTT